MKKIKFKKLNKDAILPTYATVGSACFDFYAIDDIIVNPNIITKGKLGLGCELPDGYCMKIYVRSSMGHKHGIVLCNSVAIIDNDYKGEIGFGVINIANKRYVIKKGDRFLQGMLVKSDRHNIEWTDKLSETNRGIGGFGSTGK